MALWWCVSVFCRLTATWIPLLISLLLSQMVSPTHAIPFCPRSCSCPGPKEVHCTFRHLTTIPKAFPKDTERLNLGYNSLTKVEGSEFRSLRQLEMLMLHGNDITTVHPGAFYSLRSLQILKLSYNKLTSVNPGMFQGLASLVRLHLDHNLIDFIEPYSFSGLSSLKLLQLEGNLLKDIHPHTFITVSILGSFWTSGLKYLHLSDNLLEQLPAAALRSAPRLELLSLHGNPWVCDCQLHWLIQWSSAHEGIVKCKKERGTNETCPQCSSPQSLNGTHLLELSPDKLTCERPTLHSPLKQRENPVWTENEAEPDLPYTRDFEKPLGHLTIVLSDSHGNSAHVSCDVRQPAESSPMTWSVNPLSRGELIVNVSLVTALECEIDREILQNLWQLVAYYYESPAILERGQQKGNASMVTYQYTQAINENSPYFTDLKGYLVAEPSWLLQPRVTLKLNRQQTTTKKLVLDFATEITKPLNGHGQHEGDNNLAIPWALIHRGTTRRIQNALDGSKVYLECNVVTSDPGLKVEWILPDLTIVENVNDKIEISETGQLVILNATLSDSGVYHCMVRTKAGVDLMPLRLTIKERSLSPTAFNGLNIVVGKGQSFFLPCEVKSVQPSQMVWYLPKKQILLPTQQSRRAEVMENGTLIVRRLTEEDSGEYSCLSSNLYGVDMLSHMVEVTVERASDRSQVQNKRDQQILPVGLEKEEGSGGDYQEIIRPFATQIPKKLGTQQKRPTDFSKRLRIKYSRRKPNKSVKKIDPNHWEEIMAKVKAKPSVVLPTDRTSTEQNTVTVLMSKARPTTTTTTTTLQIGPNNLPRTVQPPDIRKDTTHFPINTKAKTETYSTEKKSYNGQDFKNSEGLPQVLQTLPPRPMEPTHISRIREKEGVTDPHAVGTPQPVNRSENRYFGERRRNNNLIPAQSNRRRLPYRRRKPPMRRVHPQLFHSSSNKVQTTVQPTTITTTRTTMTTTTTTPTTTTPTTITTTFMTTTTVPVPTMTENQGTLSAEYQTEENEGEYNEDKDSDSLDAKSKLNIETSHTSNDLDNSLTTFKSTKEKDPHVGSSSDRHLLPRLNTVVTPKPDGLPGPTQRTAEDNKQVNLKGQEWQSINIRKQNLERGRDNTNLRESEQDSIITMKGQEKHITDTGGTEYFQKKGVTHKNNTQDDKLMTQNRLGPETQILIEHTTPTDRTSSKIVFSNSREQTRENITPKENKELGKSKEVSEAHIFPIMEPVHPWLHQNKQGRTGEATTSRMTYPNPERGTERQAEVNPQRPGVPPISRWPSHHHHHHNFPLYPSWQGPGSHPLPTQRPWSHLHPWAPVPLVTNRPEISAETVKPTPPASKTTGSSRSTLSNPYPSHHRENHHVDGRTQTRDQLFLSRLRNRYRQAQLDRIVQRGRMVTPKPQTSHNNPPSLITPKPNPSRHKPYIPKSPTPTTSYSYIRQPPKPAIPSLPSFLGFIPQSYHPTDPEPLYEGQWPIGAGRITSRWPTAAPPFPWMLGAESGSVKPRITMVTPATVSVLAESDVFLPCKANGNPEPRIAWTKVSTGATIPAGTKHGPRFEVLKNGTFVIKNIQLQDRGQYLCTAQNRFGSDRMVITLAVQTEAPKIQPPSTTEIAVYIGKSVSLDCFASGKPPAQISWILPDRTFVCDVGTVHTIISPMSLLQNGTLQIHSPNFSSKGDYKCIASNAAGADTITYHLHVAAMPPSINEEAMDAVIIQPGRSLYFHCSVKGKPAPAQKWLLPAGVYVKPSQFVGRRLFVYPNGTLYVKNVSPADAGRYECLATNAVGIAKRTIVLEVRADSPSLSHQPPAPLPIPPTHHHGVPSRQHSVSAMYGSAVFLHCPESPKSSRGTIWQLPSKAIMEHQYSPERPIKVFRNGTLRILQLTELDGGNYLCVFQRPNGDDMELFQVEVLMTPPRIEHVRTTKTRVTFGEKFQVDCVATGLPDPEVSWSLPDGTLINNALQSDDSGLSNHRYIIFGNGTLLLQQINKKDEGEYTCYAKNKFGKDEKKVSVKVDPNAPKILSKSQSLVMVKLGGSAKLSCQATGEPTPKIMWISPRNDVISMSSDKFQIMDDGILVKKVRLADEGKYACMARNSVGDDVKNMMLEVESQEPYINGIKGKSTTQVLAVSYQTALLDCRVEGKPEPRIWWVTPYGHTLPTPYLGGRFQVHKNGSLELRGVRKTDEGRYMCLTKNNLGEASLLVELDVASLAEKPSFAVPNIEILPIKQDSGILSLECPARGKPNPEFAWILPNGTMLAPGVRLQRFTHHLRNGTLQIANPSPSDKGVYRCLAKNVAGQAEKRYALDAGRKPVIRGSTGVVKITYGLNLNLPCTVDGWPQASIRWTLPNGLVLDKPQNTGRVTFLANGTLQVKKVAAFDKGTYICKASNSFGSSTLSYPVAVMVFPPSITNTLASITRVSRGSPVTLYCDATGIPKPDISWTLPGRTTLVPHNRFTVQGGIFMTEEGSLVIQNPVLTNSGIYKCNAKNALGTDFKSTYLQVV